MLPSCDSLVLLLTALSLTLQFNSQQGNAAAFASTNFALHTDIRATSACGVDGIEVFCSAANHTRCEVCDASCPFADVPPGFVDLVTRGNFKEVKICCISWNSCAFLDN